MRAHTASDFFLRLGTFHATTDFWTGAAGGGAATEKTLGDAYLTDIIGCPCGGMWQVAKLATHTERRETRKTVGNPPPLVRLFEKRQEFGMA